MWRGKKLLIISIVVAVVLLISVVVGVSVYAQDSSGSPSATTSPTTTPTTGEDAFIAKVASILGIDQSKVADAFSQASKELRQEAIKTRLDAMVKAGKITQAQEDEYLQWIASMPTIPGLTDSGYGYGMGGGCYGMGGHHGGMGYRGGKLGPGTGSSTTPSVTPSATSSSY